MSERKLDIPEADVPASPTRRSLCRGGRGCREGEVCARRATRSRRRPRRNARSRRVSPFSVVWRGGRPFPMRSSGWRCDLPPEVMPRPVERADSGLQQGRRVARALSQVVNCLVSYDSGIGRYPLEAQVTSLLPAGDALSKRWSSFFEEKLAKRWARSHIIAALVMYGGFARMSAAKAASRAPPL